ncbi:MAG: DUF1573 domain-containing protein [Candidatus Binatia bacterium]
MAWALAAALGMLLHACAEPKPSPSVRSAPKLAFEQALYDFGGVEQGTKVTHSYRFRNAGGLDLNVDNVRASCGCAATVTSTRAVPPGGEGAIEVVFDTADSLGYQSSTITVYSNDPAEPVNTLTLSGRVNADVAVDPPRLYVGHVIRGQTASHGARLVGDATAASVESRGKVIAGILSPAPPGGASRPLQVAVKTDAPLGKFEETIAVHTGNQRHPLLTVPITGTVDGDVAVSPAQLSFGVITPGAGTSLVLGLHNRGKQQVHIKAVHLTPAVGAAAVTTVRDGEDYRVTVTLSEGLHPGKISGTLDVDTDHPEQSHILVPFSARVTEKS